MLDTFVRETDALAGINLYQGLKPRMQACLQVRLIGAGINLNPYQGLKLTHYLIDKNLKHCGRNQPKSLSGIETRYF